VALGAGHGLAARRVVAIVDEIRAALADWPRFAGEPGVSAEPAWMISEAHD
jgi:hypothetical protein